MHALRIHDYLVRSRARVLDWTRPLSAEAYARNLPGWSRSLGQTLTHIYISEWYYVRRITGADVPPYEHWPVREEAHPALAELESLWQAQTAVTRAAIGAVADWDAPITYDTTNEDGERMNVTANAHDIFVQLAMHEVHHRSQALNMLKALGGTPADLDYNLLTYRIERS